MQNTITFLYYFLSLFLLYQTAGGSIHIFAQSNTPKLEVVAYTYCDPTTGNYYLSLDMYPNDDGLPFNDYYEIVGQVGAEYIFSESYFPYLQLGPFPSGAVYEFTIYGHDNSTHVTGHITCSPQPHADLQAEIYQTCHNAEITGQYTTEITIRGGHPPYQISGYIYPIDTPINISQNNIAENETLSIYPPDGGGYYVEIEDAHNDLIIIDDLNQARCTKKTARGNLAPFTLYYEDICKHLNESTAEYWVVAKIQGGLPPYTATLYNQETDTILFTGLKEWESIRYKLPEGHGHWLKVTDALQKEIFIDEMQSPCSKEVVSISASSPSSPFTFMIQPTPAINQFQINYESPFSKHKIQLHIYNSSGQIIHRQKLPLHQQNGTAWINTATWQSGVYFIQLSNGDQSITKQIIIP